MRIARLAVVVLLVGAAGLSGCAGKKRPVLTAAQLQEVSAHDVAEMQQAFAGSITKLLQRADPDENEDNTVDLLAMSGGGDYGAFGAGFLVGWGQVTDPEWKRPDFDAVTGVSTGALLAPFAFIGTDESIEQVETFYRNPKKDWVRSRGLLFFLPHNPSFMTIPGLQRDIRAAVDETFVEQIAAESREGRILAISATDLDFGRQKFWSVGIEAESAVAARDPKRVQDIMLASAAIPALFPPIEIDGHVYGDGGVTANIFLRLDAKSPASFISRYRAEHPDKPLPRMRYWIIINNQEQAPPATVQVRWPAVIGPSLATAIRSATLAEVRWLAAEADYVNASLGTQIEVRVVAIPNDWRPPVKGDFKKETMDSLADLGRKLGADPSSWTLWAAPNHQGRSR